MAGIWVGCHIKTNTGSDVENEEEEVVVEP